VQSHLKHVPDYLLPGGSKQALSKEVGFVSLKKESDNRIRKARAFKKSQGKGGKGGKANGKKNQSIGEFQGQKEIGVF